MGAVHHETWWIIEDNRDILGGSVRRLLEEEALDGKTLAEIFAGMIKSVKRGAR